MAIRFSVSRSRSRTNREQKRQRKEGSTHANNSQGTAVHCLFGMAATAHARSFTSGIAVGTREMLPTLATPLFPDDDHHEVVDKRLNLVGLKHTGCERPWRRWAEIQPITRAISVCAFKPSPHFRPRPPATDRLYQAIAVQFGCPHARGGRVPVGAMWSTTFAFAFTFHAFDIR